MISLSNHNSRVIGLKPIKFRQQTDHPTNDNDVMEDLSTQITSAKQELEEVKANTNNLIKEANEEIQKNKEAWENEKQEWIEQAKREGYQAGFQQGEEDGQLQYQSLLDEAKQIIELMRKDKAELLEQSQPKILDLSVAAANKIIHQLMNEKDAFISIVKDVITEARNQPIIQIFTHPTDFLLCQKYRDELNEIVDTKVELDFYPDEALEQGSCIMETPFGRVDASVDTQLDNLREQLHQLLEELQRES
ncbi:hypothetical protein Pryu01_00127 [Paraliobacillus ryukyuensis]|uniref:Flagellar assembly protein FliH n=1 Tax=Paraliobacillus ryukyuensis TaxID=200904 RepID=A0A366EH68_9BACI|nr:flagellar assembly protein FliH [Paraliobacillus ryukyuensis]